VCKTQLSYRLSFFCALVVFCITKVVFLFGAFCLVQVLFCVAFCFAVVMSGEPSKPDDVMALPRKRGLILFNPKFSHQNPNGSSQDQSDSNPASSFPKPRKYFDSADFFMREEMKKDENKTEQKGEENSEKNHHGSSLASECQTVPRPDSPDSGTSKNVVPLILLRRSKSSAVINAADGTDEEPESLPTTVEVINGPSNREIPSTQNSSDENSPVMIRGNSPVIEEGKPMSPRSREEVRSLLIPRLNKVSAHDDSSSLGTPSSSSKTGSSPLKTYEDDPADQPDGEVI